MKTTPIIIKNTFNGSANQIWNAITNNAEMKKWYFDLVDFKPEVGFKFSFTGGPENGTQYLHLCEVTEVIEGEKITYSWRYDGYPGQTFVTWEIADEDEQTLLTLTHTGLDTFDPNQPDFAKDNFVAGWTYFLHTALKEYVDRNSKNYAKQQT